MIPTLETPRTRLRAPIMADFAPYAAHLASDRARYEGGPYTEKQAWNDFAAGIGQWHLKGYGTLAVEEKATALFCGIVGLNAPTDFPEDEIGWTFVTEAEGRGLAFEAATAARAYAYGTVGLKTLVSYIDPDNTRSIRLAERLGATPDPDAATPNGDPCLVYRHPAPEALQ